MREIANLENDLGVVENRVSINETDIETLKSTQAEFIVGEISGNNISQTFDDTTYTTLVAYDRESYLAGNITPNFATGTIVIEVDGAYTISSAVNGSFGTNEEIDLKFDVNGVQDANGATLQGRGTGKGVYIQAIMVRDFVAGDVIKVVAKNNASGSLPVDFYDCILTAKAENLPTNVGDLPLDEYYRLDGNSPVTADFQMNGNKAVNMVDGTISTDGATFGQLNAHTANTGNPHSVTYSQVGAEPANSNIQGHISATDNPHSVTASQVGAVDKSGDTMTGELTIQTNLRVDDMIFVKNPASVNYSIIDCLTDELRLVSYSPDGSSYGQFYFQYNGNINVNGPVPIEDDDLTRKDYVDNNFLPITGGNVEWVRANGGRLYATRDIHDNNTAEVTLSGDNVRTYIQSTNVGHTEPRELRFGGWSGDDLAPNQLTVNRDGQIMNIATENYVDSRIPDLPTADGNYQLNIASGVATWVLI